ncbi:MAG: hypothetical protein DRO23_07165 [Thermoprotei archaeon]|nr:MAG: hypothetical protein DRO23_07165 [Thermoprotei archaeon]
MVKIKDCIHLRRDKIFSKVESCKKYHEFTPDFALMVREEDKRVFNLECCSKETSGKIIVKFGF